ncbi:hypothetical protein HORIV_62910 [Vreelandella olivaria]|uniref:Uncharacterized protein n=1 Tax=Vreelandella olivaria TaxID=390919 RepID=A0ABN5XAF4_9GAMM|nr:hypothetical protein HORIV_62910 [Halomonas olivaria]
MSNGKLCGTLAIILSFGMACLYLPGSPAALSVAEWTILPVGRRWASCCICMRCAPTGASIATVT